MVRIAAAALFSFMLLSGAPIGAQSWQPVGISPTQVSTAAVLAAYRRSRGTRNDASEYVKHTLSSVPDLIFASTVLTRGSDYRIDSVIDGSTYSVGRQAGTRWRRTPEGVVRFIESDVQGDDIDRWPLTVLGFNTNDCSAAGQTLTQWVLACQSKGDIPHWYYVNRATGRIDREVSREGSRVLTYRFDDYRSIDGATLPYHWAISGAGVPADVRIVSRARGDFAVSKLAIPESTTDIFAVPGQSAVQIPARFMPWGAIIVPVSVDGHSYWFDLDTGTTQMLIDVGAAARAGLHITLGHTIAPKVTIGVLSASDVSMQAVNLFGGRLDGLLGNEFFIGHIVHIDYRDHRVDVSPRSTFTPPPGAYELPADCSEGMPLVQARAGSKTARRFAIDTGSRTIVLRRQFLEASQDPWHYNLGAPSRTISFLEGSLAVRSGTLSALELGRFRFPEAPIAVIQNDPTNLEMPLDGVFGTNMLHVFEWWFDYDGNRIWIRPN